MSKVKQQQLDQPILNSSMARQAILNGNFDVWQRGTGVTLADTATAYQADRWFDYVADDGGTLPSISAGRVALTPGDIPNSFYCKDVATNGAGTNLGVNSYHHTGQNIENGVRFLCGDGKKVTLSFWAKSTITNKKLGYYIIQSYGSGGSPTAAEVINGDNITLTSTWTKYTVTFTTNTLESKTFGTANDDYLGIRFSLMWGASSATATRVNSAGVAETFVGSGNTYIAQVQLCAGDVALPFMPKSYEEELRACQRYYEHSYNYGTYPGSTSDVGEVVGQASVAINASTSGALVTPCHGTFKVTKRAIPTVVLYGRATANAIFVAGGVARGGATAQSRGMTIVCGYITLDTSSAVAIGDRSQIQYHWTASAEL